VPAYGRGELVLPKGAVSDVEQPGQDPEVRVGQASRSAVAIRLATMGPDGPTGEVYEDGTRLSW